MEIIKIRTKHLDSNTFVIKNKGSAIIIDAGAEIDEVKKNCKDVKVEAILLTHTHFDHLFFIDDYINEFKTNVYLSKNGREALYNPSINYGENFSIKHSVDSFTFLSGDGKMLINNFDISYFEAKGHSDSSLLFLLEDNLFVGDVLFNQGIGRYDLISGDKAMMLETLNKIKEIAFNKVFSGHGEASTKEQQERNLKVNIKFLSRNS